MKSIYKRGNYSMQIHPVGAAEKNAGHKYYKIGFDIKILMIITLTCMPSPLLCCSTLPRSYQKSENVINLLQQN